MMNNSIFNERIFHLDKAHSSMLASKFAGRIGPSVTEGMFDFKVNAGSAKTVHDYYVDYWTERFSSKSNIAIIPLIGEMSRYSYYSYGNEFLSKCLERVGQNDQYIGAVMKANTPGGTADSCSLLADSINTFKRTKSFVTHTNYLASAGVFVGSQSDEIVLESQSVTKIGSIGTLIMYENYAGYLEKEGIQMEIIRATGSEDKAKINFIEELTPELRQELVDEATAARKEFVGYVKLGRVGRINSEEVFTGKMYGAKDAIRLGLADRTGSFEEAVSRAIQIAKSK